METDLKLQTKLCRKCGQRKLLSDFYKESRHKDGVHSYCKICFCKQTKGYKQRNKEKVKISSRSLHLKKTFGITLESYKEILLKQNGVCAICGRPETATFRGKIRALSVDHNHNTGQVRGLLCDNCNHVIGAAKENVSILHSAIRYISFYKDVKKG